MDRRYTSRFAGAGGWCSSSTMLYATIRCVETGACVFVMIHQHPSLVNASSKMSTEQVAIYIATPPWQDEDVRCFLQVPRVDASPVGSGDHQCAAAVLQFVYAPTCTVAMNSLRTVSACSSRVHSTRPLRRHHQLAQGQLSWCSYGMCGGLCVRSYPIHRSHSIAMLQIP